MSWLKTPVLRFPVDLSPLLGGADEERRVCSTGVSCTAGSYVLLLHVSRLNPHLGRARAPARLLSGVGLPFTVEASVGERLVRLSFED